MVWPTNHASQWKMGWYWQIPRPVQSIHTLSQTRPWFSTKKTKGRWHGHAGCPSKPLGLHVSLLSVDLKWEGGRERKRGTKRSGLEGEAENHWRQHAHWSSLDLMRLSSFFWWPANNEKIREIQHKFFVSHEIQVYYSVDAPYNESLPSQYRAPCHCQLVTISVQGRFGLMYCLNTPSIPSIGTEPIWYIPYYLIWYDTASLACSILIFF